LAYTKKKEARYIAHLDLTRVFDRALRRAGIQVAYSEGFNPHPKIAFGPPLPVGVEGQREYVDIDAKRVPAGGENFSAVKVQELLQPQLPEGIEILESAILPQGSKALMAMINLAVYRAEVPLLAAVEKDALDKACKRWLARREVITQRVQKDKRVTRNIREFVKNIEIISQETATRYWLKLEIKTGNAGSVRPVEVLESLSSLEGVEIDLEGLYIVRDGVFIESDTGELLSPLHL